MHLKKEPRGTVREQLRPVLETPPDPYAAKTKRKAHIQFAKLG